ncbi:hypothetical protein [Pseudochrobactrum sp. MP213Fo]|uniref:hypothetical protein n=1 Tax=Pseudochrobactrum sp. MP213Fo TaxID=3022250 RepID=UPI003B9DED69
MKHTHNDISAQHKEPRFTALKDNLYLAMRIGIFSLFFVAPIAAFTGIAANTGGKISATGLVLFVSLQK